MDSEGQKLCTRLVSADPVVMVEQLDYGLTHAQPIHVRLRSGRRNPMTYYDVHPGLELGVILSGREQRLFQDTAIDMEKGDAWLASMWEIHGLRSTYTRVRVLTLVFLPEFLGEAMLDGIFWLDLFAVHPDQRPRVRDQRTRARVVEISEELWTECERRPSGWRDEVRLNMLLLLLALRRGWSPPPVEARRSGARERGLPRILPALQACQVDPSKPTSVAEAAAACGVSERHFGRLFQQSMGMPFTQFRLRTRIEAAARYLLVTNWPVEGIAKHTGFSDASHFHHTFVKQHGCTPAEYRRRFRE